MVEELIRKSLDGVFARYVSEAVIMMELPVEAYFEVNAATIKYMTEEGYEGLYISVNRPLRNIISMFEKNQIDMEKLYFIDVSSIFADEPPEDSERCIHVSPDMRIDEMVQAIYESIPKLQAQKKFIFLDSLTTITLYQPLSETMRFCEFLMRLVKNHEVRNIIFNVAHDLVQKKFIQDVALQVDEVVRIEK